jgi:glycosyltransferase involved in cell wall biosynthesis
MKISIILTTFKRPNLLKQCLQSIVNNWPADIECVLLVGNQCMKGDVLVVEESYNLLYDFIQSNPDKNIKHIELDYDCGITKARNELINRSKLMNCDYTILTADSICVDSSLHNLKFVIASMIDQQFDLIGFNLLNRVNWEGWITLNKEERVFELDFIDPKEKESSLFVPCSIVRNFWIAKTDTLTAVSYDEDLKMCEHELWAWQYNKAGFKIGCTNFITGTYVKSDDTNTEYKTVRQKNFNDSKRILLQNYNLANWIKYIHPERIQHP